MMGLKQEVCALLLMLIDALQSSSITRIYGSRSELKAKYGVAAKVE